MSLPPITALDNLNLNNYHPSVLAYQQPHPFLGSPHHSLHMYQPSNMTPYALPNEYMTPHPSQMYLQQPLSSIPPTSATYGGLPPYGHPLYDAEPSCFESFLESFCCCFGYGVPQNHYELMQKREMQHRRLIAKEERHRLAQFQKLQEKQRQLQIQQRQQQLEAKNTSSGTAAAGKASTNEAVV